MRNAFARYAAFALLAAGLGAPFSLTADAASRKLTVAGGPQGSAEMLAATGLCNFMNQEADLTGYVCEAIPAPGSGDGLKALKAGRADLAFVDSNMVDNAADRLDLRTVLTMFPKLLTIATTDKRARRIEDLHKGRIATGPAGTQATELLDLVLENRRFRSRFDLDHVTLSSPGARTAALCNGDVEAAAYLVSHPSTIIDDLADSCEVTIIQTCCDRQQMDRLAGDRTRLAGDVTGGIYPGSRLNATTVGVRALLVAHKNLPDRAAAAVVNIVADGFERFRMLERALFRITPEIMGTAPTPLVRHPGSVRAFRDRGIQQ